MVLIKQVATYLAAQGLGTVGTDIFFGYLPDGTDNCIGVFDTGGMEPDIYLPTKEPTFQVFVRSSTYLVGKAVLDSVRTLLHQKHGVNLVVGDTFYYFIHAISEGGHIGRNDRGQDEFTMNFHCRTR